MSTKVLSKTLNGEIKEGIEISREIAKLNERLNTIKTCLREAAALVELEDGSKTVTLTSQDGEQTVSITFPRPSVSVSKKANMGKIQSDVGDLIFGMFFKTKISHTPAPDFEENLDRVEDPIQKQALLGAIIKKEATPRVSFPK